VLAASQVGFFQVAAIAMSDDLGTKFLIEVDSECYR
jgi:hypothetical protein